MGRQLDQQSALWTFIPSRSQLLLYMSVALTKRGGRDTEAISYFRRAFRRAARESTSHRDTLWARAFFSRALRRQGQDQEADEQEIWIRKKVREQLPAGLGLSGRRGLLPFLLDDGEKLGTSSIVQRIGLDYFKAPEIVDVSTGTVYVPIRTPGGRGMLTTVGHPPFFKPGDDLFFLLSEEKRG